MRDCTCVGSCRGAAGLGPGWNCVVDNGSVEDARIGPPSAPVERESVYPTAIHYEPQDYDGSLKSNIDALPWRDGPAVCTNCGESAKPHPAYADFVGPFCEGCWDRLREYFTSGVVCPVCKHEHDRETSDCR